MSNDWLKEAHLEAIKAILPTVTHPTHKRRLRECFVALAQSYAMARVQEAATELTHEPVAPLVDHDLDALQLLLAKGVMHNGSVPDLDVVQVQRSLQILGELLGRAQVGALSFEDREGLEWVFDVSAEYAEGANRKAVRRLEQLVRGGLGLGIRFSNLPHMDPQQH